jgi:hypothetical protein
MSLVPPVCRSLSGAPGNSELRQPQRSRRSTRKCNSWAANAAALGRHRSAVLPSLAALPHRRGDIPATRAAGSNRQEVVCWPLALSAGLALSSPRPDPARSSGITWTAGPTRSPLRCRVLRRGWLASSKLAKPGRTPAPIAVGRPFSFPRPVVLRCSCRISPRPTPSDGKLVAAR